MIWEAWFTLGVVAMCLGLLVNNRIAPDIIMLGGLTLLLIFGIVTPDEALAGFANQGMITVGVLYVVVSGLRETGGVAWIVRSVLGRPRSETHAQIKMMAPVALFSAFLNNTPVVAMFIPAIQDWAKQQQLSVSKLLIPLSYAAIAGGVCTLIGTSTNLVVNGLLISKTDLPRLGMFDIAWVGLPIVVILLLYIVLLGGRLIPARKPAFNQLTDAREYTVEMLVEPNSPLAGATIEDAGLRHLPGMYLVEIEREGEILPAVSPRERLRAGDRLVFAGIVESVVDLQKIRGLTPATDQIFKLDTPRNQRCLTQAVIANDFPAVGKSVREARFRTVYNAAIIAVSRDGEQIRKKIGDIVLKPGDMLLLESHPSFVERQRNSRDFFLVSRLDDSRPLRHEKSLLAVGILASMVIVVALELFSMLQAAMLAAGLMIITRCTTSTIARRSIDWQVLLTIAASFGIGNALQSTGAAATVAGSIVSLGGGEPIFGLVLVFVATALLTNVVTNNVAAVLMFPIALAASETLDVNFMAFAITIMVAASAAFASPIGYQTNLMVYGPGGYQFSDYIRVGVPLTVLVGIVTLIIVPLVWPL